jgi:chitodextrinase
MVILLLILLTVSGLTSNTEFTFTVKTVGNNGHLSAASNIETITTKPNAPTALTATQTKSSSTVLSWTHSSWTCRNGL